jgi:hypothetical protein
MTVGENHFGGHLPRVGCAGTMPGMQRHMFALSLTLALATVYGCGGQTSAGADSGSSSGSGSGSGGSTALPPVDSGACTQSHICTFCDDDAWHCGGQTFPSCPAGTQLNGPCTQGCVSCDAGMGLQMLCFGTTYSSVTFQCAQ